MSKLSTIYINSKNRDNGTSTNFNFNLQSLGIQPGQRGRFSLKSATIPYTGYVTSYSNLSGSQSFLFQSNISGATNINVPNGNYSPSQLIAVILPQLNALGTFTMTYSNITGKFTIDSAVNTFTAFWSVNDATYQYQRIGLVMGFTQDITVLSSTAESNIYANLSGPANLYIRSYALTYNEVTNFFNNKMDSIIGAIPVNATVGNTIIYTDQMVFSQPFMPNQINQIDVMLCDEYGNEFSLNGLDWSFVISIYNDSI